jgi:hypothetical protein
MKRDSYGPIAAIALFNYSATKMVSGYGSKDKKLANQLVKSFNEKRYPYY